MNIREYILVGVIVLLSILSIRQCSTISTVTTNYNSVKKQLIDSQNDALDAQGENRRLIDDIHDYDSFMDSIKQANKHLSTDNEKLFEELARIEAQDHSHLVGVGQVVYKYETKTDTVYIDPRLAWKDYYYPSKDSMIVKHSIWEMNDSIGVSQWHWGDVNVDLVVSQGDGGVFEASLVGPDFISLGAFEIDAMPFQKVHVHDEFDWLLGGQGDTGGTFSGLAGVRMRKNMFLAGYGTHKQVVFQYLRAF